MPDVTFTYREVETLIKGLATAGGAIDVMLITRGDGAIRYAGLEQTRKDVKAAQDVIQKKFEQPSRSSGIPPRAEANAEDAARGGEKLEGGK